MHKLLRLKVSGTRRESLISVTGGGSYIKLSAEYEEVKHKIEVINLKLQKARANKTALENFLNDFSKNIELIDSFYEKLFNSVVNKVVINIDSNATFVFKNGQEILVDGGK